MVICLPYFLALADGQSLIGQLHDVSESRAKLRISLYFLLHQCVHRILVFDADLFNSTRGFGYSLNCADVTSALRYIFITHILRPFFSHVCFQAKLTMNNK
jgi:hypothetical protein